MRPLSLVVAVLLLVACKPPGADVKIDDATVEKYIRAYRKLRELGPALAQKYGGENPPAHIAQADFAGVERALREAGFKDYPEFVRVNAKIAWAFSNAQARAFLSDFEQRMAEGEKQFAEALANPQLPPEARAQIEQAREKVRSEYLHNRKWADVSMSVVDKLTDKETLQVVLRHRAEIEAAFTGK